MVDVDLLSDTGLEMELQLSVYDGLDDTIYDQPLTLEIAFPADRGTFRECAQLRDGQEHTAEAVGSNAFRIDVMPDGVAVRLRAAR